jgi:hypothetical protein
MLPSSKDNSALFIELTYYRVLLSALTASLVYLPLLIPLREVQSKKMFKPLIHYFLVPPQASLLS